MTDHVRYRNRGGHLVHKLFVMRDIKRIFDYRESRMAERFGSKIETLQAKVV